MKIFEVEVVQMVNVVLDETKFTPKFMKEFRDTMYKFDTLKDHAAHLAQLHARGLVDDHTFIEGYGLAKDMGIIFQILGCDEDVHLEATMEPPPGAGIDKGEG